MLFLIFDIKPSSERKSPAIVSDFSTMTEGSLHMEKRFENLSLRDELPYHVGVEPPNPPRDTPEVVDYRWGVAEIKNMEL
jgi:hypothetical protein